MNKLALCVAVIVALIAACSAAAVYDPKQNHISFERWLISNDREYSNVYANNHDAFEFEFRRQVYLSNLQTIRAHNERYEQGLETWFMIPTQYADLTTAEFETRHLGLTKLHQTDGSRAARRLNSLNRSLKIADFKPIDWTKEGVVPPPVNQGSCGSCWSQAAAHTLTSRINIELGTSAQNYVSRQQATSCVKNPLQCGGTGGCSGATAQLAFELWAKSGVITEQDYPYTSGSGSDGKCLEASYNPTFTIAGHKDIAPNNRQALFDALQSGPVSVSAYASNWSFYGGGIFSGAKNCNKYNVNHAITLTGVGVENGTYYYTIMNSWGAGWGEKGSMRLYMAPPAEDEVCGEDTAPYDGSACKLSPEPPRTLACGCTGLLYDSAIPVGIKRL